jgi:hypothetical protein
VSSASSCPPKYFVRPHRITTTFFPFTLGFFWYFFFPIHDCLRRLSHGRFIVAQLLALPFAIPPLTLSRFFRFVVCRLSFRVSAQQSPRRSSFLLSCFCIIVPVPLPFMPVFSFSFVLLPLCCHDFSQLRLRYQPSIEQDLYLITTTPVRYSYLCIDIFFCV